MSDEKMERVEDNELLINARKPEGELGDQLLDRMNKSHESLAQWGVSHLDISKDDIILDIGCGGGVNVERFLKMTENKVYGLDYSEVAVEKSKKLNQKAIEEGRCEVIQGSVSELPFDDEIFDIVTGFETVYFWPDFVNDLKEVRRVLKEDGIIFICNEAIPRDGDARQEELKELLDMNIYSDDELDQSLRQAGFSDLIIFDKSSSKVESKDVSGWICAIAKK
ncbi:SAM-dependent methyltransferase [Methanobrevibacter ruminantium M1]|uniref:SAM-dependent methyltransferase n=1 Tax=Methanobrevibacter ruminantium (strain ATCC 35063 / DSM 1093 / JCM 13430 / OCM 146 / M1) TaxID=634498 RepID=D3E4U9_METRM|nr:class I SAM-dependent methyltransferase [Methanobrevibacter ruminantium]ADC47493.1 SAM-dependent methyltransferase [Methanobrevibacter ruminantium M1]